MARATDSSSLIHFASRAAFRAWLAEHHSDHPPIWLLFFNARALPSRACSWSSLDSQARPVRLKRHTRRSQCTYDEAVEEALCFGWIDSLVRRIDEDSHARLFSPRKNTTKWSASNLDRVRRLVAQGLMTEAGMARLGVVLDGPSEPAPSADSASSLDADLEHRLRANRAAFDAFQRLAPSHRRNYVRWIMQAKREATRLRRLDEAIDKLSRGEPLGMK